MINNEFLNPQTKKIGVTFFPVFRLLLLWFVHHAAVFGVFLFVGVQKRVDTRYSLLELMLVRALRDGTPKLSFRKYVSKIFPRLAYQPPSK